jgi:hypothetical protein
MGRGIYFSLIFWNIDEMPNQFACARLLVRILETKITPINAFRKMDTSKQRFKIVQNGI